MSLKGYPGWNLIHSQQFGERWDSLKDSLYNDYPKIAILPPFQSELTPSSSSISLKATNLPHCFVTFDNNTEDNNTEQHRYNTNKLITTDSEFFQFETNSSTLELNQYLDLIKSKPLQILSPPCIISVQPRQVYFLDPASSIAPLCLKLEPFDRVLDACAAPGGKSLLTASLLFSHQLHCTSYILKKDHLNKPLLVCNEYNQNRLERLKKNLTSHLPKSLFNNGLIKFTNEDACKTKNLERLSPFNKILLDAACSSDKHLIVSEGALSLARWSPGVIRKNSKLQKAMLNSMISILSSGGSLLYCTCALSNEENDKVIESLLNSSKYRLRSEPLFSQDELDLYQIKIISINSVSNDDNNRNESFFPQFYLESTRFGAYILPDKSSCGPLYFSKIYKF